MSSGRGVLAPQSIRKAKTLALWVPHVLSQLLLCASVPGGDLTISVLWLSVGLHCAGNHCLPPFPQPVGTRLTSWPLNQLPYSSGCLDATGDSCAFVAFSGPPPRPSRRRSLALWSPGMGSGLGAPRTREQP